MTEASFNRMRQGYAPDCADPKPHIPPRESEVPMLPDMDCFWWPVKGYAQDQCAYKGRIHGRSHDCRIPDNNDKPALCATE